MGRVGRVERKSDVSSVTVDCINWDTFSFAVSLFQKVGSHTLSGEFVSTSSEPLLPLMKDDFALHREKEAIVSDYTPN